MNRSIVLPELFGFGECRRYIDDFPGARAECEAAISAGLRCYDCPNVRKEAVLAYARAAVEADRKGIVVTDEDVEVAWDAECETSGSVLDTMRAALESYAKRLRGET